MWSRFVAPIQRMIPIELMRGEEMRVIEVAGPEEACPPYAPPGALFAASLTSSCNATLKLRTILGRSIEVGAQA